MKPFLACKPGHWKEFETVYFKLLLDLQVKSKVKYVLC